MTNILKHFLGLTVVKPNQPVGESTVRPKVKSGTAAGSTLFIHHNFRNIQNHTDFKIQVQYKAIYSLDMSENGMITVQEYSS